MTTHHNHHTKSITRILIYLFFPSIANTNISGQKANNSQTPFPHKNLNKTNILYSTLYKMKHMQMILFPTNHANSKIIQNRIQLTLFGPSTQYFYYKNPSINPNKMIIASSSLDNMAFKTYSKTKNYIPQ